MQIVKHFLICMCVLFFSNSLYSQVIVGRVIELGNIDSSVDSHTGMVTHSYSSVNKIKFKFKLLKIKQYDKLKTTTTIFFYQKDEVPELLEEKLNEVWTITPLKIVSYKEKYKYIENPKYSYFDIQKNEDVFGRHLFGRSNYLSLNLILHIENENPVIASIPLTSDFKHSDALFEGYLSHGAQIRNWTLSNLYSYLKIINTTIEKRRKRYSNKKIIKRKKLRSLKKQTLYIPKYSFFGLNLYTNTLNSNRRKKVKLEKLNNIDENAILGNYKFEPMIIEDDFTDSLFLDSQDDFYYLSIVVSNVYVSSISVVNGKTGEIIYSKTPKLMDISALKPGFQSRMMTKILAKINKKIK